MPEKVTIKLDGGRRLCGLIQVEADGRQLRLPPNLVYDNDPEFAWAVVPRWLAEEKDLEHRIVEQRP